MTGGGVKLKYDEEDIYERRFVILLRDTGTGVKRLVVIPRHGFTGSTRSWLTRAKTWQFGHMRPTLLQHIPKAFAPRPKASV